MGLRVIVTNFSGPTDFANDANALPLAVAALRDDGLAEPSRAHLRELMRRVAREARGGGAEARDAAARRSELARSEIVRRFHPAVVARQIVARLEFLTRDW